MGRDDGCSHLTADDKGYEAEVTFGLATDSYDAEGVVISTNNIKELSHLTKEAVEQALLSFLDLAVKTSCFSAIKVDGERLYVKQDGEEVMVLSRQDFS